jgi:hypothetical protein
MDSHANVIAGKALPPLLNGDQAGAKIAKASPTDSPMRIRRMYRTMVMMNGSCMLYEFIRLRWCSMLYALLSMVIES